VLVSDITCVTRPSECDPADGAALGVDFAQQYLMLYRGQARIWGPPLRTHLNPIGGRSGQCNVCRVNPIPPTGESCASHKMVPPWSRQRQTRNRIMARSCEQGIEK